MCQFVLDQGGDSMNKKLKKYSTLVKVMQLPGTTLDEEAIKQMGEYAKNPGSYLKDVNQMLKDTIVETRKEKIK